MDTFQSQQSCLHDLRLTPSCWWAQCALQVLMIGLVSIKWEEESWLLLFQKCIPSDSRPRYAAGAGTTDEAGDADAGPQPAAVTSHLPSHDPQRVGVPQGSTCKPGGALEAQADQHRA